MISQCIEIIQEFSTILFFKWNDLRKMANGDIVKGRKEKYGENSETAIKVTGKRGTRV